MAYVMLRSRSKSFDSAKKSQQVQKPKQKEKDMTDRAMKIEEDLRSIRTLEAVHALRDKPAASGLLMQQQQSLMGLGETKWRERYVILDPRSGTLAFWDAKGTTSCRQLEALAQSSAPMQEHDLGDLMSIETNEYHNILMLSFCRPGNRKQVGKALTFQADSEEDFDRWVQVISGYGTKENARPMAARAA